MTDELTGLHNLHSFELEWNRIVREALVRRQSVALMVLDVDRLKGLNDEHGHLAGAEAVRTVGRLIAECMPPEAVACRYGGDEFVIALQNGTASTASVLADTLRDAVHAAAPQLAGQPFRHGTLSISIGLVVREFNDRLIDISRSARTNSVRHCSAPRMKRCIRRSERAETGCMPVAASPARLAHVTVQCHMRS